jgi:uncharacterized protein YgbK (DUF1537 family)
MPKILVIADDFTGAAEIGGIAHLFGLSVRLVSEISKSEDYKEEAIIIDTNTRRLSPEEASSRIKTVLADADFSTVDLVYKKVDSVIRGPVESEIKTVMSCAGLNSTILMPANPSRGRTIQNGKYLIDGIPIDETDFKHDPEYPRTSNEVAHMIADATQNLYVGDPAGTDIVNRIIVPDASMPDNFKSVINALAGKQYLPAGGADFFRALLQNHMHLLESKKYSYHHQGGKRHFIIGSRSHQSNLTICSLKKSGYSGFYLTQKALEDKIIFSKWLGQILQEIHNGGKIYIARPERQITDPSVIEKIILAIATATQELIYNCSPGDEIFIEGGETASTIIKNLDSPDMRIMEVIADGVVKLEINDSRIFLIVKPGSYKWSENLINAVQHNC